MKGILVLDNHDSFVYNLVEFLRRLSTRPFCVLRPEDAVHVRAVDFAGLLLSPGPGLPEDTPAMMRLISEVASCSDLSVPSILGICLGHQAIGLHFGAHLKHLTEPKHGHRSQLVYSEESDPLRHGLSAGSCVGRYHSWALDTNLPASLVATAYAEDDGCLMAMRHISLPIFGLQFHPESIITDSGERYITNWLKQIR